MTNDDDTAKPTLSEKLRDIFGTGSLTDGAVTGGAGSTGGLDTGAGDMSGGARDPGDPTSGGADGVDASGEGEPRPE
ncbi:hypothetical protein [Virgisporangium ochraceum]|uniref:Uncharacterized protein n=1 Tax=Virgisporangium ochraceum TaxID=65505 RepID=A0A8J3ZZK1_9ACTN|nr:hypothetical protein [Virgisporangium ochraceum]GIJ73094.1 hypothetical protein Voc01_080110 [Virgisporangium ochraceum]